QDRFWEFNETVYAGAPATGHPDLSEEKLLEFAKAAGVPDLDRFRADLDDPDLLALVERDFAEAQAIGIGGTPFFLIGDEPVSGAQPEQFFRAEIEKQLDRAGA
ncbi:DsbA family protein, partial [Leucobacter sp. M11]|uniref:DsbA family protein n=1 Tax=Leucobacter sp. M11 TaxID=2993565 RepID=UPI002D803A78